MDASGLITAISVFIAVLALLPEYRKVDISLKFSKLSLRLSVLLFSLSMLYFLFWDQLDKNSLTFGPVFINGFDSKSSLLLVFFVSSLWIYTSITSPLYFSEKIQKNWIEKIKEIAIKKDLTTIALVLLQHKGSILETIKETKEDPSEKFSFYNSNEEEITQVSKNEYFITELKIILRSAPLQEYIISTSPGLFVELTSALNSQDFLEAFIERGFKDERSFFHLGFSDGAENDYPYEFFVANKLFLIEALEFSSKVYDLCEDYIYRNQEFLATPANPYSSEYFFNPVRTSISFYKKQYKMKVDGQLEYWPKSDCLYSIGVLLLEKIPMENRESNAYLMLLEVIRAHENLITSDSKSKDLTRDLSQRLQMLIENTLKNETICQRDKLNIFLSAFFANRKATEKIAQKIEFKDQLEKIVFISKRARLDTREVMAINYLEQQLNMD